ncbi:MAG: hypothetical protein KAS07_03100 [Candidatus Pacebacteria bacterium]|nr:hypothetical protein [Candidatus Paceibacterota bacterium]
MRTKKGEEYLSSKDACAISSFSEEELRFLCLEGKVRSRWLGGGYFVEKASLLSLLKKKTFLPYGKIDLERSLDIWHSRIFNKFGILMVVTVVFLTVFVLPVFFLENNGFSGYDITKAPASFNSVAYISEGNGTMAAVGYINDTIATAIEKGAIFLYDLISNIF